MSIENTQSVVNGELTNRERAERIILQLEEYCGVPREKIGEGDLYTAAQDIISDIMHLCQQNNVNFNSLLTMAEVNYSAEIDEENRERPKDNMINEVLTKEDLEMIASQIKDGITEGSIVDGYRNIYWSLGMTFWYES